MKREAICSAIVLMGLGLFAASTPGIAADPYRGGSAWSWTGFYAGLHAGYGFGGGDVHTTGHTAINVTNVNGGARPARVGLDQGGFVGGGHFGYNWAMSGIVFGIEVDQSFTDVEDSVRVTTTALNGVDRLNNDFRTRLDYLGTVRGRLGVASSRTLFYVTGGLAYGDVENSANFFGPAGQLQFTGRRSGVEAGYVVGGGIEHAFARNWTLKGEYLYYDLGSQTVGVNVVSGSGGGGTGYNSRFENDGHIVRAGLSYKF